MGKTESRCRSVRPLRKRKRKLCTNQNKLQNRGRWILSPAWALGKHSACETIQVIELSAAVTYLGLSDRNLELSMAAAIVAGSASYYTGAF